jgi:hypothetical protein
VVSGTTTSAPLVFPVSIRRTNTVDGSVLDSDVFNFVTARIVELVAPGNSGSTQAVGVSVSGFDPAQTYRATLLQPPRQAWSAFPTDGSNGGLTWNCIYRINTTVFSPAPAPNYATAALAFAASSDFIARVIGSSTYVFWMSDPNPSDNRGGLTIRIRPDV